MPDNYRFTDLFTHEKKATQISEKKMGHLDDGLMSEVNNAIAVSFGLGEQGAAQTDGAAGVPTGSVIA